jgi:hypothetical protein
MLKDFFDLKRTKSVPEAVVFYAVCAVAVLVLSAAADHILTPGGF